MLFNDGEVHRRLRAPVGRAFTPRRMAHLRARCADLVDEFLAPAEDGDEVDLQGRLFSPLPALMLAEPHRRRQPGEDLISALVDAERRGELAPDEVVGSATLLLFAGHETTTNAPRQLAHRVARDRLDLDRRPVAHVAFGHGAHFCVGAALARLEMNVTMPHLARRYPDLAPPGTTRVRSIGLPVVVKTVKRIPVTLGSRVMA
ncbi:MAG: cytochrome P450 [Acidimicrobiales bacterium]